MCISIYVYTMLKNRADVALAQSKEDGYFETELEFHERSKRTVTVVRMTS
jgi:hypothetical protein